MKLKKILITNFRLLKNFNLELQDEVSLILGKNNTGKTSILTALNKFLNSSERQKITIDDFNVDLKQALINLIEGTDVIPSEDDYEPLGITMRLQIEYDENDDLETINQLIMSLDPDDNKVLLSFEYLLSWTKLLELKSIYQAEKDKYNNDVILYLAEKQASFFGSIRKKSLSSVDDSIFTDLSKEGISLDGLINFQFIDAKRNVTNRENDKTLSTQTAHIYKNIYEDQELDVLSELKEKLRATDKGLSKSYSQLFQPLLEKVMKFGGIKENDTSVEIISTLQQKDLLDNNTTVMYSHDSHQLPEHYNGLGYMNLISMIFELEGLMGKFRKKLAQRPSAINLLFIEEPEAHTHPQMQYVFINNIKSLLRDSVKREDGLVVSLQTIISTHSSHIVAESDFDDIKYLKKDLVSKSVIARNLSSLEFEFSCHNDPDKDQIEKQNYKFLKQYLTLNRAEIFFADKVVLIEGDTERLLLPAMMKKIDSVDEKKTHTPLLSQNISIVEVGAHSQIFDKLINFIGVKTLIITDIDSYYDEQVLDDQGNPILKKGGEPKTKEKKCPPNDPNAQKTSNASLLFYHGKKRSDLQYFIDLPKEQKTLSFDNSAWTPDTNGNLMLVYQVPDENVHGRSFEDAFFSINKTLLGKDHAAFPSLTKKWFDKFVAEDSTLSVYCFADKAINSKPSLAIEILMNSIEEDGKPFTNWKVPRYIQEGLEWLITD